MASFYIGDGYSNSTTDLSNSIKQATYQAPTYTAPSEYTAPVYDESRITDLTQTSSAGAIRGLRSAMQRVAGGSYANPNVRRMTLREALAGYGQGLQSAISAASETARKLYNTEYETKAEEKKINYNTAAQASQAQYQAQTQQSQAEFAAEQNRYNTEYQTAWANYNTQRQYELSKQQTEWANYNTQRQYELSKQELELKRWQAEQDAQLKRWQAEQVAQAKNNPYGYGITRPPKGADAYENARWFAAHGIG
jgi:hypothetical protein